MARVTDLSVVQQAISDMIDEKCPDLVDYIGRESAIFCVLAIYQVNDICSGYGQDFTPNAYRMMISGYKKVSVISFENGVSVIVDSASSRYQDRFAMCGYEDLDEDLTQICICIQAAFDRMQL
jgi:hypothetical protein